jgi:hypothetical protein
VHQDWRQTVRRLNHSRFRILGGVCLAIGFLVAVAFAYCASGGKPLSGAQSVVFVIISGLFQAGSAWFFSHKTPDVERVRSVLRRHERLDQTIRNALDIAEYAHDDDSAAVLRHSMGELSWRLSQLEVDHYDIAVEWISVNKQLLSYDEGTPNADSQGGAGSQFDRSSSEQGL